MKNFQLTPPRPNIESVTSLPTIIEDRQQQGTTNVQNARVNRPKTPEPTYGMLNPNQTRLATSPLRQITRIARERTQSGESLGGSSTHTRLTSEWNNFSIRPTASTTPSASTMSVIETLALSENTNQLIESSLAQHETSVLFTSFPAPGTFSINEIRGDRNNQLSALSEQFGINPDQGAVFYNPDLVDSCGLTKPNEDPEIGPAAFSNTLNVNQGQVIGLDDDMVALQVALTIAHELSHANQFDQLPYIDNKAFGARYNLGGMPLNLVNKCTTASHFQTIAFETMAYHSEVRNLCSYINEHAVILQQSHRSHPIGSNSPSKLTQLKGMLEVSVARFKSYYDQMPHHLAEDFHFTGESTRTELLAKLENIPEDLIRGREITPGN